MKNNIFIVVLLLFFFPISTSAQLHTADTAFKEGFAMHVTSVSEFMHRFNGEQFHPDFANADESVKRVSNLMMLFDLKSNQVRSKEKLVCDFVNHVDTNNLSLSFADTLWYAQVNCDIRYKDTDYNIDLFLKPERVEGDIFRWAIVGVRDFFGNVIKPRKWRLIDSTDNELDFIVLQDRFKYDSKYAYSYRSIQTKLDQLSVFLTLVYEGSITLEQAEVISYHFFSVPGYYFAIERIERKSNNTGWLISDINSFVDKKVEQEFRYKLLGGDVDL